MPEPQPMPVTTDRGIGTSSFLKSLMHDTELLMLGGFLAALCAWFVFSLHPTGAPRPAPSQSAVQEPVSEPRPPFALMTDQARNWLPPAMLANEPRPDLRPLLGQDVRLPPPQATASVAQHALLAEPMFDPLGSLVVSGLPQSSRLSAGAELSPQGAPLSDWAIAFGDLDNLVVTLPRQRDQPLRTTLDLRTRAGVKITSLTVEVREEDGTATPSTPVAGREKSKVRPAKASQTRPKGPPAKAARAIGSEMKKPLPPPTEDAYVPPKVTTEAPPTPPTGLSALLPLGFFKPDPKDSAASGLSPDLRDDPRFTTLRGLGMSGTEQDLPAGP